jgi:competence protein ComFC
MMLKRKIRKIKEILLDIFFPKFCFSCQKEGSYICEDCLLFLTEAGFVCPTCGKTEHFGRTHINCKKRKGLNGLVSLWDYEGLIKKLIHEIKYNSLLDILEEIMINGFFMIEKNEKRFSFFLDFLFEEKTVITFVPLTKKKENKRGFNQSEEIAKKIALFSKKEAVKLLIKRKENISQTNLNKEEREENVKDIFCYKENKNKKGKKIKIEKVVLIDDVWTSGATMRECCRVLKENGVKEVWGFTLAKVA